MKRGFDSKKYLKIQSGEVVKGIKKFKRLYLEIGGKLTYDNHASRVLPGYKKTIKINLLKSLGELAIIYCINAKDLEFTRLLSINKITYQKQILKNLRDLKKFNLPKPIIVITRFEGEEKAKQFSKILKKKKFKIYFYNETKNYTKSPTNAIRGYKSQNYIPIKENLIIITGPAGNSGKMATALSQIYHEKKMKIQSAFAKLETFPVHNLPLSHPINLAYESATADLQDKNQIDILHKKYHNIIAVNYNRDIDNFRILKAITKQNFPFGYKSPTDMGISNIKSGIIDDELCRKASIKEIKRRYKFYKKELKKGRETIKTIKRMEEILKKIK
ncbi:MAG: DUF1846 domain-containing protein [archaeon]